MSMMNSLMLASNTFQNKTFLITGGATGLGRSMALALLHLGGNVILASRKEENLQLACKELSQITNNKNVIYKCCDVRKYDEVDRLLEFSIQEFGKVDGVINNAAGNFITPTEKLSPKAFDIIVDIVLKGTYNVTLAFGKKWIENSQNGVFLNIVTTYAESGSSFVVPSACAKAGVVALTKSLASEWGKYGIRSNAIAPGPFPTEGAWDRLMPLQIREMFDPKVKIPLKRWGKHEELANLVTYLLSDYSGYINGAVVTIDGGEFNYGAGEFNFLNSLNSETWQQIEDAIRNKGKG